MAENLQVTVAEFEAQAAVTDQLNPDDSETPLLGLVGEVGSLLSALKKKRRDTDAYFGYHEVVVEELGDVLWYLSAVAQIGGTSLSQTAAYMTGNAADVDLVFDDLIGDRDSADDKAFEVSLLKLAGE